MSSEEGSRVQRIRNVIFDLGGVLLEWQPAKILAKCCSDIEYQETVRDALFRHDDWLAFNRGDISESDLIAGVQGRTGFSSSEVGRILDTVRDSLVEIPETVAVLQELRKRGVPLYCLSDMPVSVFTHVRQRYNFWDAFRGIVISGEVRMMKPSHLIFEHLLGQYNLIAGETAFVDDHPPNIAGARTVGIEAILFRDADQCRRDLAACLID
jgi:putative hydrolase of the HAD superfamily